MTESRRREEDLTVDRSLRITTTLGFIATLVVGTWFFARWTAEYESDRVLMRQEIHQVLDIAERNERTMQAFIARTEATHDEMDDAMVEMHHEAGMLREYLGARFGEPLP